MNNNESSKAPNQPMKSDSPQAPSMQKLAALSMPTDVNTMLVSVDEVLADAMQHINASLQQSFQQVDTARQRLLQDHPSLQQAYDEQPAYDELQKLEPPLLAGAYQKSFEKKQQEFQQEALMLQNKVQTTVGNTKATINQEVESIAHKLIDQQKNYENGVLSTSQQAQKALYSGEAKEEFKEEQKALDANMATSYAEINSAEINNAEINNAEINSAITELSKEEKTTEEKATEENTAEKKATSTIPQGAKQ
ncbi:hypothetical protein CBF23_008915 [Marinomonas agarivorans]|nr:hypothetical protein CBF23_008915 [Marinomonas agarivorans]